MPIKLKQMREKVQKEIRNIPSWPEPQRELRMCYWTKRMHSLGKKATVRQNAKEVLKDCIAHLRKDYPDFEFKYDKEFFERQ